MVYMNTSVCVYVCLSVCVCVCKVMRVKCMNMCIHAHTPVVYNCVGVLLMCEC